MYWAGCLQVEQVMGKRRLQLPAGRWGQQGGHVRNTCERQVVEHQGLQHPAGRSAGKVVPTTVSAPLHACRAVC